MRVGTGQVLTRLCITIVRLHSGVHDQHELWRCACCHTLQRTKACVSGALLAWWCCIGVLGSTLVRAGVAMLGRMPVLKGVEM